MMVDRFQSDTVADMGSEPDQPAGLDVQLEWPGEPEGRPTAARRSAVAGAAAAEAGEGSRAAGAAPGPLFPDVFTALHALRGREGRPARGNPGPPPGSHLAGP